MGRDHDACRAPSHLRGAAGPPADRDSHATVMGTDPSQDGRSSTPAYEPPVRSEPLGARPTGACDRLTSCNARRAGSRTGAGLSGRPSSVQGYTWRLEQRTDSEQCLTATQPPHVSECYSETPQQPRGRPHPGDEPKRLAGVETGEVPRFPCPFSRLTTPCCRPGTWYHGTGAAGSWPVTIARGTGSGSAHRAPACACS